MNINCLFLDLSVRYLYILWVVDWSSVWPKPLGTKRYIANIHNTLVEKTKRSKVLDTLLCQNDTIVVG